MDMHGLAVMFQPKSSVCPWTWLAFAPPPAIHQLKACQSGPRPWACRITLSERRTAELAAQMTSVVQHASFFHILHQEPLTGLQNPTLLFELREQALVLIPTGMHELHTEYTWQQQAASDQTNYWRRVPLQGTSRRTDRCCVVCLHPRNRLDLARWSACGMPSRTGRCADDFGRRILARWLSSSLRYHREAARRASRLTPGGLAR